MMEFTAREWRAIWEQLRDMDETVLAARITHEVGRIWNTDHWDRTVAMDVTDAEAAAVHEAAERAGIHGLR